MRKVILKTIVVCLCLGAMPVSTFAQEQGTFENQQVKQQQQQNKKWRRWYFEAGMSVGILLPEPRFKTMVPVGADFGFGFLINPHHRLSLNIAPGSMKRENGTFTYTRTGSTQIFTDGVITRRYSSLPVLFSYHYVFTPSEKNNLRLGASLGSLRLSAADSFKPVVQNTPNKNETNETMFVFGLGFGYIRNFSDRAFMDIGYKLLIDSGLSLDDFTITMPGHQFNISIGFRF